MGKSTRGKPSIYRNEDIVKIQPAPDRKVRDPVTGRELTGPLEVPDTDGFWLRCLAAGDVHLCAQADQPKQGSKK
jgi:hypothetical protein